jgi:hypothetical protein
LIQTILTVVLEVEPASEALLRERIRALRSPQSEPREHLSAALPTLHFMSLTVFEDDQYDPVFVLEANFDGKPGPFWGQLEAKLGPELRDMLRCCRAPRDRSKDLFSAVTRPGSRSPIAPLLEARTVMPAARHQGNRGLDRNRILQEGWLFAAAKEELDGGLASGLTSARQIHQRLREALLPTFEWLERPAAPRVGRLENVADWLRFLGLFVAIVAFVVVTAVPGVVAGWGISEHWVWPTILGVVSAALILGGLAAAFRQNEIRDPPQDAPKLDPDRLRAMAQLEDSIAQNHMISLVHVKPGILRAIVARVVLLFVGYQVRAKARSGYLASMRTIHFAHWSLVSNGSRLMFHSNFDGSWESYLDDFIEKAHAGLTAVWTHAIGFPPTRWLAGGGASSGGKFKAWARHSMSESQFWHSAYKEYSVNQIERHTRVAAGLRKPTLTDKEAKTWALDL